jgi:glutamyl-tRNA synthetase
MEQSDKKIRVRFAPSPTGYLHVGHLRLVLTDYLFAKKQGGTFVLRVEDTDRKRFVNGAVMSLIQVLSAFGLDPDEGVMLEDGTVTEKGEYGPYTQSERLPIYRQYADELLAKGKAYRCFCSPKRLEEVRAQQTKNKLPPKYDRHCLHLPEEEVAKNMADSMPHVIRMVVPDDRVISFIDLVRGEVKFHTRDVDDQVIMKSDGFPTYHLAVVVDDHLMKITHVIRGEEWLSSTPKHLLLFEAFGWEPTEYAHLPLLLNPDRSKLSKRQGDVAVEDYLKKGYLAEALINFVALLGWNPGKGNTKEIFSLDELVEAFDLGQIHKAGAVFDLQKLDWMNGEYIKRLTIDELYERAKPFFEARYEIQDTRYREDFVKRVLTIERERLTKLSDVGEENPFFFAAELDYDAAKLRWKTNSVEDTKAALAVMKQVLESIPEGDWTREEIGERLLAAAGEKRGDFLWPLRMALSGKEKSPPPQDIAWVIGKEASLARVDTAIGLCR